MPLITPSHKLYHKGLLVKRMYRAGTMVYQAPATTTTTYLIDYISDSTAYLYPYTDRADSPKVSEKYLTVAASSIPGQVQVPTPVGVGTTAEMPQLTEGNAYGYLDINVTRGSGTGHAIYYRNVDASNRWEVRFTNAAGATSLWERINGAASSPKLSLTGVFPANSTHQLGLRVDGSGHIMFKNGVEVGRFASVGSNPAEATVAGTGSSGVTINSLTLYPYTATI